MLSLAAVQDTLANTLPGGRTLIAFALSLCILGGATVIRRHIRRGWNTVADVARLDHALRVLVDRIVQWVVILVGVAWALDVNGLQLGSVITILGISGVAIGLSLQDVLRQTVGGLYVVIARPFTLGDRLNAAGVSGIVQRIGVLVTVLDVGDGVLAYVPNLTFVSSVVQKGRGTDWVSFEAHVPHGDDMTSNNFGQDPQRIDSEWITAVLRECAGVDASVPIVADTRTTNRQGATIRVRFAVLGGSDVRGDAIRAIRAVNDAISVVSVDG